MLDIPQQNPLKYGFSGIEISISMCIYMYIYKHGSHMHVHKQLFTTTFIYIAIASYSYLHNSVQTFLCTKLACSYLTWSWMCYVAIYITVLWISGSQIAIVYLNKIGIFYSYVCSVSEVVTCKEIANFISNNNNTQRNTLINTLIVNTECR